VSIKVKSPNYKPIDGLIPMGELNSGQMGQVISCSMKEWIGDILIRTGFIDGDESDTYLNLNKGEVVYSEYVGDDDYGIIVKLLEPGEIVTCEYTQETPKEKE